MISEGMPARHPLRIDTLGKVIEHRYRLTAYCNNQECRHRADLPLDQLARRLGPDHSSLAGDLVPILRCSRCEGKNLSLTLAPPTGYDAWQADRPP